MHTPAHSFDRRSWPVLDAQRSAEPSTMPHLPAAVVLMAADIVVAAAAYAAGENTGIFSDPGRRAYCLAGAAVGAFCAVLIGPKDPVNMGVRAVAGKFAGSFFGGVMLTPLLFRWRGWPMDADMLFGITGCMAFLTIGSISLLLPKFFRWLDKRSDKYLGDDSSK